MAWEWQMRRCFDGLREALEEKGWEYIFVKHNDAEAMPPLLAKSGDYCIAFFDRDPGTGEC